MKRLIVFFLILVCAGAAFAGGPARIKAKDLDKLSGARWKGALTYLDYSRDKKVSIKCDLVVSRSDEKNSWKFTYEYPDEPNANSSDTIILSKDGKVLDGETVLERVVLSDGSLRIVTQKNGMDNDKKAIARYTYLISNNSLSIKKEVKYEEKDAEFFVRNEYSWKR